MFTSKFHILSSCVSMLLTLQAMAQQPTASAVLERDSLMIGDQVILKLLASIPAGHLISWPDYRDTLVNHIEIIKKSDLDTIPSENPGWKTYFQDIVLTGFDSGVYRVPPIRFFYGHKDDTVTGMLETRPFYIQVHTMEIDTSQAIKPIKPPLSAPFTFAEALPWLLTGMGLILVGLLIFYYLKKRKADGPVFKITSKPKLPAHVLALHDLEDLRHKKLWQAGKVKEYYSIMTDIVRHYIEERFKINAIEMTTDEILSDLRKSSLDRHLHETLGKTLTLADLVKFAKENPLPLDNDNSLNNSIYFVESTIPAQAEEAAETQLERNEKPLH